jgi:hypothetical protein
LMELSLPLHRVRIINSKRLLIKVSHFVLHVCHWVLFHNIRMTFLLLLMGRSR